VTEAEAKLLKWILFGVFVSTLPIIWAAVNLYINLKPISLTELLGNGDLLMATCAGCAVAQGEVLGSESMTTAQKLWSGFFALLVVVGACLVFSSATSMRVADTHTYEGALGRLTVLSCVLFVAGLVSGGFAVWASAESGRQ
jgi:hypothetical protein